MLQDYQHTLATIYGPKNFLNIQDKIEPMCNSLIVETGMFHKLQQKNYTMNYVNENNVKSQKQIHHMMNELDLVDIFRALHPDSGRCSGEGEGGGSL